MINSSLQFPHDLNQRYFHGTLPPEFLKILETLLKHNNPKYIDAVDILFSRFTEAGLTSSEITSLLLQEVVEGLPRNTFLDPKTPFIPPITIQGRHARIDQLLAALPIPNDRQLRLLDLGCGFPPITAVDAADALPRWEVIGADPAFYPYLLTAPQGYYGCLDTKGDVRFIWSSTGHRSLSLQNALSEFATVRDKMNKMANELFTLVRKSPSSESVEQKG